MNDSDSKNLQIRCTRVTGRRPVKASCRTTPNEKTSLLESRGLPDALLWRHVSNGPEDDPRPGATLRQCRRWSGRSVTAFDGFGQSEVCEFRVTRAGDQDVCWFDIAMKHAGGMGRGQAIGYSRE